MFLVMWAFERNQREPRDRGADTGPRKNVEASVRKAVICMCEMEDAAINDEEPSSITLHERTAGHAPRFWTRLGCHVSALN